jgi:alkanesulfonate monooxygenase SsuD/methylene tetrahydromethanopterin reductase-like flavin-dependent oxidoreductase (luciferase family)
MTWERWRHIVHLAERLGYPSLFRSDHFFNGLQKDAIDVYLSFVMAATESENLRFGPLVTPITFRPPVVVGRMAQQLDALSDGRFVMGLGAGWFEDEHRIYGLPYPPTPERYDRLEEALELMKVLWYDEPGVYKGAHYQLDGTESKPHPPPGRPKILIGGTGPKRTLRLVAQHADEWNSTPLDVDDYRKAVDALERHCADVGRDPATVRRSMLIFATSGPTKEVADLCGQRFIDMMAPGSDLTPETIGTQGADSLAPFTGSAQEMVDHLGHLAELGLQEVVFEHFCTEIDDFPEWIAAEVTPHVADL